MQNEKMFVRQIDVTNEDDLFLSLSEPYFTDRSGITNSYCVAHIVCNDDKKTFAVYEQTPNMVAVRFVVDGEELDLGEKETVQFMSADVILLIKNLGAIAIADSVYGVDSIVFHITDGTTECRQITKIHLRTTEKEK